MRAAAYLLLVWPFAFNHSGKRSYNTFGWSCAQSDYGDVQFPRALFSQIQMMIQHRCGELEKELLRYLQRSIFDSKRRTTNALPNYLVLILLLSTYNFLGVKSWVSHSHVAVADFNAKHFPVRRLREDRNSG